MVDVAGAARLMWIMSQLRSLLLPINRLDRHVDIQDPRLTQYRLDACPQLAVEPFHASALLYAAHRSMHHVFTDRAAHVQQRRIEPISPHRVVCRARFFRGNGAGSWAHYFVGTGARGTW